MNQTLLFNLPSGPNSVAAVAAACVAEAENRKSLQHNISIHILTERQSGIQQIE